VADIIASVMSVRNVVGGKFGLRRVAADGRVLGFGRYGQEPCCQRSDVDLCMRTAYRGVRNECLEGELYSGGSDRAHWCSVV
jgi:hypothetical protein